MRDRAPSPSPETPTPTHELKVWPQYFAALLSGKKTFEFRQDDREPRFAVGDVLRLREWGLDTSSVEAVKAGRSAYSGREVLRRVTYIARETPLISEGFCVMSIEPCPPPSAPREAERLDAVGLQQILHDAADGCDMDEYDEYGREYGNVAEIRHAKAQLRALAAQIPDLLAASARLFASEARVKFLEGECRDWENREAAVCPEDVGFDEFIRHLTRKVAASEDRAACIQADYDRFQRSTAKQLADRDAFLIELQARLASLLEKVEGLPRYAMLPINMGADDMLQCPDGSYVELAAVRYLLAPSEDTSDA